MSVTRRGVRLMSKKKRAKKHSVPKTGAVWRQTSEEATLAKMPRYDAFAGGYGPHGSKKYDRAKVKQDWRRQIGQEGASRGSFPLCAKKFARALDPLVASRPMMPLEDTYGAMV